MSVDPKKPVVLKNRTNYFVPSISRVRVRFSSSDTYQAFNAKCEGYESRLYWEFKRSQDLGGKTFFYTLTYNDKNIPSFEGQPCFDYDHLRHFLNGGFKKMLLRRFGTNMRYFVGAELGDGKGSRGVHNNPHYHILFFLRPDESGKYPYIPISRWLFRHYVRLYWQGFDQDIDLREGSFHSFKDAFLGIAKEGSLHLGEVLDFRAISYVSKYVTKDVELVKHEATIEKNFRCKYNKEFRYSYDSYVRFLHSFIYDNFNIPTSASHTDWTLNERQLAYHLEPEFCKRCKAINDFNQAWIPDFVKEVIKHYNLQKDYDDFCTARVDELVKVQINLFRNRYSNKCRISQNVGDYALEHLSDVDNPTIQVPDKNRGFKERPLNLYYYRKLFTEIYSDVGGHKVRILNSRGIAYKCSRLESSIFKTAENARCNVSAVTGKPELFASMLGSSVNTEVSMTYDMFMDKLSKFDDNERNEFYRRYGLYKLVYEDRFVKIQPGRDLCDYDFPPIDCLEDYRRFLTPTAPLVHRYEFGVSDFLENTPENCVPYYSHPYFLRYYSLFLVLDLLADYFFVQADNQNEKTAREIKDSRRFHTKLRLRSTLINL